MESIRRFRAFLSDTWGELKKTTWPDRKEVVGTTVVVIVAVLICAAYLWIVDWVLGSIVEWVFKP